MIPEAPTWVIREACRFPFRQDRGRFGHAVPHNSDDRFSNVLFYGVVLCLAYLVFLVFQPFLVPLGWAAVFAVIFYSLNQRLERRWGRTLAASVSTAGVALILVVPVLLLATLFVREGIEATRSMQAAMAAGGYGWFNRAWEWIVSHVAQRTPRH